MKTLLRTAVGAAALALAAATSGCNATPLLQTDPQVQGSHWNIDSLDTRVVKQFTGYKGAVDGKYWSEYRRKQIAARRLTLRRHFLNNNPYNPFEPEDPSITRPKRDFDDPPPVRKFRVKNK